MADNNYSIMISDNGSILGAKENGSDLYNILSYKYKINKKEQTIEDILIHIKKILSLPNISPLNRIYVLNQDESIKQEISNSDIMDNGISYSCNYSNGTRRTLTLKLMSEDSFNNLSFVPSVDNLWQGKKIRQDMGIQYEGSTLWFKKGIYQITGFNYDYGDSNRMVTYDLSDKFSIFEDPQGTITEGYEIPVGSPVKGVVDSLLNMSRTNGELQDLKIAFISSYYNDFITQQSIREDSGGTMSDIIDQLSVQMSAEYQQNQDGVLSFQPMDESLNAQDKPIIWDYEDIDLNAFQFKADNKITNVVKVIGNSIDGKLYSAIVKNEDLSSAINIQRIGERVLKPIEDPNIYSDANALDLAKYYLKKNSMLRMKQNILVPQNPLLEVNNYITITNKNLLFKKEKFLINGISYTAGEANMTLEISNVDNLCVIGGIKQNVRK